jgi:glutamate synthase domain-containing protein 1
MNAAPPKQGLYDPEFEHDACGIGFVVNIKGVRSHAIVKQALEVLNNLNHRGAAGCEANTGDGAGILIQLPHAFLKKAAATEKITLPAPGAYGLGMMFFPRDEKLRREAEAAFEKIVAEEGQSFLGWRTVPTNNAALGATAQAGEPLHRMAFIGRAGSLTDPLAFERKLYVIRKRAEHTIKIPDTNGSNRFYIPSLSARTVVFKGMLLADQMEGYFHDLNDPELDSALALVHSRFSTNTFPNWNRAHPYRYIIHNGEINTLRGNINWMHARQALLESPVFGDDLKRLLPVVDTDGSDSAMFDNCLEFLVLAGRSLPHAMMMMIPSPGPTTRACPRRRRLSTNSTPA